MLTNIVCIIAGIVLERALKITDKIQAYVASKIVKK